MKKQFLRIVLLLCALAAFLTAGAAATDGVYAVLYKDGTLVFQHGNTPESGRAVTAAYPVDLANGYTFDMDNWEPTTPWYGARESITAVDFADTISPQSTALWFYNCQKLAAITNLANLDTSHVTNMRYMFYNCYKLTELDVSGFDTSHVTNMSNMFVYCMWLTALDVSGFDTSNVTDMSYMFSDCNRLAALDVSGFDTSHVTNMMYMFAYCGELATLDLSGFDTSHVTSMSQMFYDCDGLAELNLSAFDTSNVKYMLQMFAYCDVLTTIRVSERFVTSQVTEGRYMFSGSTALVGGSGTRYSEDHQDVKYARIDSAAAPGYFTYAAAPITPTPTPYPAPQGLSVSPTSTGVKITWEPVPGVTKYRVYRKTADAKSFSKLKSVVTGASYTTKSSLRGTAYDYAVCCLSDDGKTIVGPKSNAVTLTAPVAPQGLSVTPTKTTVKITWEPVPGVTKYRVYRRQSGAASFSRLKSVVTGTSYTTKSSVRGTAYDYAVCCLSDDGTTIVSPKSDAVTLTAPAAPELVSAQSVSTGIKITWKAVPGVTNYRVYRKTAGAKSFSTLKSVTSGTSYTNKNAVKGTEYIYTVCCLSDDGKTVISPYQTTGVSAVRR